MSDLDIQFGDLEEEQPDVELRPDRNKHYAVEAVGEPQPGELPIFVDLDVMIEMESHALTDTSVELGGVMLGGQLVDEEGKAYVLIKDSLRAEHYEATKGSFKFTHDTWQQITRDRDDFPSDWDMVGWYHTHPDWGVFLSGMDMFICDNFFNKPLDVALVIDPCRQDRGLFQWTGNPQHRKRRVGGFYLIASRHRQEELEDFAAELEEGYSMRTDPNLRGRGVSAGGGPTVVNISEQRPGWLGQAVLGLLVMQFLLILLVGYRVIFPPTPATVKTDKTELSERERIKAQTEVLDRVIASMDGGGDKVATTFLDQKEQADELAVEKRELLIAAKASQEANDKLRKTIDRYKSDKESDKKVIAKLREDNKKHVAKIDDLTAELKDYTDPEGEDGDGEAKSKWAWLTSWPAISGGLLLLACIVGGVIVYINQRDGEGFADEEFPLTEPPGQNASPEEQAETPDEPQP